MIFALIFLIPTFLLLTACTIAGQVGSIVSPQLSKLLDLLTVEEAIHFFIV